MYRSGYVYDEIDKVIIDIYLDYNFTSFPLDEREVCSKLGVDLVAYSEFPADKQLLLMKKSKRGFFFKNSDGHVPTIYYNDLFESKGAIRFTIFHELKHYVFDDKDDENDDLADYFARHFMGPTSYLIQMGLDSPSDIALFCGMSNEAANYAYCSIVHRKKKYGLDLFDYEIPLINLLDPSFMNSFKHNIIVP